VKDAQEKKDISSWRAVKIGFLTNILNPKTTLFFLSLFTLVISPETPYFILIILGTIMIVNTFIWFSLVAIFFTQKRIRNTFNTFQGTFNKVLGGLFIGLGIKIGLTQK
jgi:threonine/homoserine/homoserine lactone efflux protein